MSRNGKISDYWRAVPASTEPNASAAQDSGAPLSQAAKPRDIQPIKLSSSPSATPYRPQLLSPEDTTVVSSESPSNEDVIFLGVTTLSGASKTSPDSPFSSQESFPESPFHASRAKACQISPSPEDISSSSVNHANNSNDGVIRDSDEDSYGDGDDDDDAAESFLEAVRYGHSLLSASSSSFSSLGTAATKAGRNAQSSSSPYDGSSTPPLAKRRANTLLTSPLPLRRAKQARRSERPDQPKHKFDMKALLRHAKQDDATEAAVQRVSAAFAEDNRRQQRKAHGALLLSEADQQASVLNGLLGDHGGAAAITDGQDQKTDSLGSFNKERLRRAFDRTEVAAVSEQWYFFKEHFARGVTKHRPFPKKAAAEYPWDFLQDDELRQDYFTSGIVRKAVLSAKNAPLPEELFLWILDEACVETKPSLRAAYTAILRLCPEQVRRFFDTERLLLLFQQLGPRWESIDLSARLELVPTIHRPYPGRDWSSLQAELVRLASLAESLALDTVLCAVKILLRLGIDRVVEEHMGLLQDYQEAMRSLVQRVPTPEWDNFCYEVCLSLYNSIQKPSLRWQVLVCLPSDVPACHELRRRLASVCFFDDPARARQDPQQQLLQAYEQGRALARLVAREDFVLTADTNYADLAALANLLDVYIDNAGREEVAAAKISSEPGATLSAGQFNADVDELARRLGTIGRSVDAKGGGHVSRLDSKTALQRLQIRLTHSVRTKRLVRKNIFDRLGGSGAGSGNYGEEDEEGRPKQKDIRTFFLQTLAKRKEQAGPAC